MKRLVGVALLLLVLGLSSSAAADFTSPALLSGLEEENFKGQFTEANAPAISADGRYAVFQGVVDEVSGVYRRELQTGKVEAVAAGLNVVINPVSEAFAAPDAAGPSISADGQYVAFTTTADLPTQGQLKRGAHCPNVYIRNMDIAPEAAGAYTLASVLGDGSPQEPEREIQYASGSCPSSQLGSAKFPLAGAQAAPAVALSADGQQVVFTVLSSSNLGDPECVEPPSTACLTTAASQIAMRDLETKTTTVVSVTPGPDGKPATGGGAYPSAYSESRLTSSVEPLNPSRRQFGDQITGSTAAISADGSTVAWLGTNVSEQVSGAGEALGATEVEPLWRRVADGASATTKRLLSEAGLEFGYWSATGQLEPDEPLLSGSLVSQSEFLEFIPPAISADGRTVAVLANAPASASVGTASLSSNPVTPNSDAYVVRVEDSSAAPVVTRLTSTPAYNASAPALGDVKDLAISPDGEHVAFDTTRTNFAASPLALISPPVPYEEVFETYEANLTLGTLQRVVSAYDGSTPDGDAGLLSFSEDGQALAFASSAGNLFYGDALGGSQVYVVHELPAPSETPRQIIEPAPALALPPPDWILSATASAEADGTVLIDAEVPGPGKLSAQATAQLPEPPGQGSEIARRGRRTSASRRRTSTYHARKARASSSDSARKGRGSAKKESDSTKKARSLAIKPSTLAGVAEIASGPSAVQLDLRVAPRYSALVAGKSGLYAIVRVSFSAPGHATLTESIPITFHLIAAAKATKRDHVHKTSGPRRA